MQTVPAHAWRVREDHENQGHVWTCTCEYAVVQPYGTSTPDELISHPQSYGQMRGE